jgi:sugar O-acyltransferase (sialic acid O-acetyltransferase NeuD family)
VAANEGGVNQRGIWVIGAGGHAKVVIATLRAAGILPRGIFDDDVGRKGDTVLCVTVVGAPPDASVLAPEDRRAIIAIGANAARKRIAEDLPGFVWQCAVHPGAIVDSSARLGPGSVVFAGAVIQPDVVVGAHVIVNTGARIDHDGAIGDYAHVAPGCVLGGGVRLAEGAFLGVGACVIPGRAIGAWTTVGAGAAVIRDLPGGVTAVGVPARIL